MDTSTFVTLRRSVQVAEYPKWYDLSYGVFTHHVLKSEEDFVKIVAFAYSWMPTVPEWYDSFDWIYCAPLIESLREGDLSVRKALLEHLVPVINNSIVGVSKVLHFISPYNTPIIDSNVIAAWRKLFFPHGLSRGSSQLARLPGDFGNYGKDARKRSRHIQLYVQYWDNMLTWSANCGDMAEMRDIESLLYAYGMQLSGR
jgi:hypothetical protein